MLERVWLYAEHYKKKESSADLIMSAQSMSNYMLRKNDELALYEEVHEILSAKIPSVLPCVDNPAGMYLSPPEVNQGTVEVRIPGFLTLSLGLLNAYHQASWLNSLDDPAKKVFAYENYLLTLKGFMIHDLDGFEASMPEMLRDKMVEQINKASLEQFYKKAECDEAGVKKPEFAAYKVPNHDQFTYLASLVLQLYANLHFKAMQSELKRHDSVRNLVTSSKSSVTFDLELNQQGLKNQITLTKLQESP